MTTARREVTMKRILYTTKILGMLVSTNMAGRAGVMLGHIERVGEGWCLSVE